MARQLMDREQLKDWVLRQLGAPVVKVQLTCEQLEDFVDDAQRWFSAKKGVKKRAVIPLQAGKQEYELDEQVDTVIDVNFPVPPLDLSLIFSPFILLDEKVPYDVFAAPSSAGLYSSFVQAIQSVQMSKRILGAETDWRQEGRTLYIFPNPSASTAMFIEFKSNCFTIEQLNERDHDLVKRYSLAKAKEILGLIRSTYSQFPTAQGTVTLNGAALLEQAQREREQLEEEISLSGFPMGFMKG